MKRYWSRLLALVLVVTMGLMGCSSSSSLGLSGDYRQDTLALLQGLRTAIELPEGSADKAAAQSQARQIINDFASRYRRNTSVVKLSSYTTMRTALNSLAGHYSSYPNRPLPEKLKNRLEQEFQQVETALRREA
ncbi:photosystem II protein Psb27 [Coleofasciculus sp. H7-2]|uniref:photosystem II protein Psb27 n=1 Tax=Coleofasciculus sp. H7-2 TaxID=3351545 RepID=UPI00366CBC08